LGDNALETVETWTFASLATSLIVIFFFIIFSTRYDCLLATFANYCYSLLTDLTLIAKLNAIVCEYSQYGFGEIFCVQRR
jgi:hypothetical protein